jgi:nitrite reductase (NO-forming)
MVAMLSLGLFLAWALAANAQPATKGAIKSTVVKVVSGKPSEYHFTFSKTSVAVGTVTFDLTNSGTVPHDLKICSSSKGGSADTCTGRATPLISPGSTAKLTVTFAKAGKYEYLCTFPGHAALGMKGDLTVT